MLYGDLHVKEIQKKKDICTGMAHSLCHTAETNNIVKQLLYANKNEKKNRMKIWKQEASGCWKP